MHSNNLDKKKKKEAKAVIKHKVVQNKGEVKSNDNIEIHTDDKTGRRYSCNMTTGVSEWINDEDEKQDNKTLEIHRDDATGRRYSVNVKSGETKWMDEDQQEEVVEIYEDEKT